jgi:paraquat-inducible protein B
MARKANPALIGAFVVGAVALALAGLVIFSGGRFFEDTQVMALFFDESIKGLAVGSPVTFRGVKVGSVTDIRVVVDRQTAELRTPVLITLEADRFTDVAGGKLTFRPGQRGKTLIERGLRAQLEVQSFVTGQLGIELDFHPGTPVRLTGLSKEHPELPTLPSTAEKLSRTLQDLPVDEIARDLKETLGHIRRLVGSPELQGGLASAARALEGTERIVSGLDERIIKPIGAAVEKTEAETVQALREVRRVIVQIETHTVPALNEALRETARLARDINRETVPAVTDAAKSAQQLLRDVDSRTVPEVSAAIADVRRLAQNVERTSDAARVAMEEAQRTLETVGGAVEEGSPLGYELRTALGELRTALRAVRLLADYLERHPEALVFGKSSGGSK